MTRPAPRSTRNLPAIGDARVTSQPDPPDRLVGLVRLDRRALARDALAMPVYKILRAPEAALFAATGRFAGTALDRADGYVHLSTAAQVAETARRHFAGEDGLTLVALDEIRLAPELAWEPARGGDLFPHLYREMRAGDALWSAPMPLADGAHTLPAL